MVGLAEQKTEAAPTSSSSASSSNGLSSTRRDQSIPMASVELSGRFDDDHFSGKWRFDGSPQWLEFNLEKNDESSFQGHFQFKEDDAMQNIPETIVLTKTQGKALVGKGSNKFGEFELWGERDEHTKFFTGYKKYVNLRQDGVTTVTSRKASATRQPSNSETSKRPRLVEAISGDEHLTMDESLGFNDDSSDVVDAAAVFANESEIEAGSDGDFDANEDLLSEFQLITDGQAGETMVDDVFMDVVPRHDLKDGDISLGSPASIFLAVAEPLSADIHAPISPLRHLPPPANQSRRLTPATIGAPPSSTAKPKATEAIRKFSLSQSLVNTSDGTASTATLPSLPPSVSVKFNRSFEDPLDDFEDTPQVRARRRVRDFVVGLQSRHFCPYDPNDIAIGLPIFHPLRPHVEVVHGDPGDLSSRSSFSPSSKKKTKIPSNGTAPRKASMSSITTTTTTATMPQMSVKIGGAGPEVSSIQLRYPGSTKCVKAVTTSWLNFPEFSDAKLELDGSCYEGDLVNGVRHGKGVAGYFNGCVYVGDFARGKEDGHGELRDATGALLYRGRFEQGKICGQGTFYYPDGSVYRGEMREGTRHGHGIIWYSDGSSYEGDFSHGVRSGNGTFTAANGSVYRGEWSNDVRHGKGVVSTQDGTILDAQFRDNSTDGKGIAKFADESKYEGNFKDGLKEGRGTYTFPCQASYEGRFKDDDIGGMGTLQLCVDHVIDIPHPMNPSKSEWMVPVDLSCEVRLAHLRAGFGADGH